VSNFSDSIAERESQKKHYFFDNGILNLFLYQPDTKLLENIVALELHKKYGNNLFYYNKNIEVDFCVPDDGLLVQVSYDMKTDETRKREFGALVKAAKFFKAKKLLVITYNQEEETEYEDTKISVIPVWKFLIDNE
jgi:predicted AAA+ superfamily ATPase